MTKLALKRVLRREILTLIYQNHERQGQRYDDVTLTGVLERLGYDVYVNLIRELLEDLHEREMVRFKDTRDPITGRRTISLIEIRPRGSDFVEGNLSDPAIQPVD